MSNAACLQHTHRFSSQKLHELGVCGGGLTRTLMQMLHSYILPSPSLPRPLSIESRRLLYSFSSISLLIFYLVLRLNTNYLTLGGSN